MVPTFDSPSARELDWVTDHVDAAPGFVEAYSPDDAGAELDASALDRAFAAWLAQGSTDSAEINTTINLVGCAFGSFLVRDAGFEWVIATDEQGSDLAVLALPGTADLMVYPANFVAKRWEAGESMFLRAAFVEMAARREELAATPPQAKKRSFWRRGE